MTGNPIVDGFDSPEAAAEHAIAVQHGFTTPAREARRMLRDGGKGAEVARAWLTERGLSEDGEEEPPSAAVALPAALDEVAKAAGTEEGPAVQVPTAEELGQVALCVAALEDRADQARAKYNEARAAAEAAFAVARRYGTPQVEAVLPDGTKLGLISIEKGAKVVQANEDDLLFLVATTMPAEVEEYVVPGALHDERVVEVLRQHVPDVVNRRIRRGYREQLQTEMDERDGFVVNQKTGDLVEAGVVHRHEPTGKFSYRKDRKKIPALREAIAAGLVTDMGEIVAAPAGDGGEAA